MRPHFRFGASASSARIMPKPPLPFKLFLTASRAASGPPSWATMQAATMLRTPRTSTMTLNEVAPLGGSFRAATGTAAAAAAAAFAADAGVVADADAGAFEDAGEVARLLLGDAALGVDGVEGAFRDGDRDARAEGGIELDADFMTKERVGGCG